MEKETVGKRILLQRKKCGYTQTELGDLIYVSKSTISNWEKDDAEPKLQQFKDLAKVLNCSSNYLMGTGESSSVSKKNNNRVYGKTIQYRRFTHEWKLVRDTMLLLITVAGIITVTIQSEVWFGISCVLILIYFFSVVIVEMVDVKQDKPDISYPIGDKLVFIHDSNEDDIKKLNATHRNSMALQLFIVFFSFITFIGITNDKLSIGESIFIVIFGLFLIGWTIFMFVEIIRRSYMKKEIKYNKTRKRFGHFLYEMNMVFAFGFFISNLVPYYKYNYEIDDVILNFTSIVIPGLYILLAWAVQFGLSKFYAKFKLYSYNKETNEYTCLEEVE